MATCGEAVVRLLEQYDTRIVFGIPGVHTLEMYRGLASSPIRHVSPRHEQGAAFMADGYARVSGKPGCCILITGAGLTNAATPIASAYHDSIPLLIVSSATHTADSRRGHGALHDLPDQQALMRTITAASIEIRDPVELAGAFAQAYDIFTARRPRPVHIGIPTDVLELPAAALTPAGPPAQRPCADASGVAEAAAQLAAATRPLIMLGGGAARAGVQARRLAELIGAPIGLTINAKGAVASDDPVCLGSTLTLEAIRAAYAGADVVLAAGTEFSETDYFFPPGAEPPRFVGSLIRIDIDPTQLSSTRRPAAVALNGDATTTLAALADTVAARRTHASGDAATRAASLRAASRYWPDAAPFIPFLEALRAAAPRDTIITADSTQPAYVAHHWWPTYEPFTYLAPGGYGTLGPALPMAIGAKLAAPDRPVMCLIGDGGLLFTVAELASAADLGLPLAIVVWHNDGYGEMRDSMDQLGVAHIGTAVSAHDFQRLAAGCGCDAVRVEDLSRLAGVVKVAFDGTRPTLIEVASTAR